MLHAAHIDAEWEGMESQAGQPLPTAWKGLLSGQLAVAATFVLTSMPFWTCVQATCLSVLGQ